MATDIVAGAIILIVATRLVSSTLQCVTLSVLGYLGKRKT